MDSPLSLVALNHSTPIRKNKGKQQKYIILKEGNRKTHSMAQALAWTIPGCGATDEPCSRKHPFPCSGIYWRERGDHLKFKFILSICFGGLWLAVSLFFAIGWAQEVSYIFPSVYVWWVIIGIALLPGFLMSAMFFPIYCTGN